MSASILFFDSPQIENAEIIILNLKNGLSCRIACKYVEKSKIIKLQFISAKSKFFKLNTIKLEFMSKFIGNLIQ